MKQRTAIALIVAAGAIAGVVYLRRRRGFAPGEEPTAFTAADIALERDLHREELGDLLE